MIYAPFSLTHSYLAVYLSLPDVLSSGFLSQSPRTQARLPLTFATPCGPIRRKPFFLKKKKTLERLMAYFGGGLFDIY